MTTLLLFSSLTLAAHADLGPLARHVDRGAEDSAAALEAARAAEVRKLWAVSREPASDDAASPVLTGVLEELWTLLASAREPSDELGRTTRQLLRRLAERAQAHWATHWTDAPDPRDPGSIRLEARLQELSQILGLTLARARATLAGGDPIGARELALDGWRVVVEAYLLAAATAGDRREQCERTGSLAMVAGGICLGPATIGLVANLGSPVMMVTLGLATGASAVVSWIGFANAERQYRDGRAPLLMPEILKRHYRKKSARHGLRWFWLFATHYGLSHEDAIAASGEAKGWMASTDERAENVRAWFTRELRRAAGDDDPSEFCEKLLGTTAKRGLGAVL